MHLPPDFAPRTQTLFLDTLYDIRYGKWHYVLASQLVALIHNLQLDRIQVHETAYSREWLVLRIQTRIYLISRTQFYHAIHHFIVKDLRPKPNFISWQQEGF